jgi:hypothetical protein
VFSVQSSEFKGKKKCSAFREEREAVSHQRSEVHGIGSSKKRSLNQEFFFPEGVVYLLLHFMYVVN